jgi:hypothetical protein
LTTPLGGFVLIVKMAGSSDGLPRNPIARLAFIKTTQGYLPGIPLVAQKIVFDLASLIARVTGLQRRWRQYFT